MSLISQGTQPISAAPSLSGYGKSGKFVRFFSTTSPWLRCLFFLFFLILFYCMELFWLKPVNGTSDDWGIYGSLSGAYLGYPEAHVLFFLYPLSWLLSKLYILCSYIPWYGLFMNGIHVVCLFAVYHRSMQIWNRHNSSDAFWKPALTIACILFLVVDLNTLSEVQYTTTAGLAAAAAVFYFTTTRTGISAKSFLVNNIPTFIFVWISYSIYQTVFYLMLPIAGMLWLSKWINAHRNDYEKVACKLVGFALILAAGMGILYGLHLFAYSDTEWSDFRKINHYRERIEDFYTWPEYEECADALENLGISEEEYMYRRNGIPYIGHGMSLESWMQMNDIARECFLARTDFGERLKDTAIGAVNVFLCKDGMQPANILVLLLMAATLLLIFLHGNQSALLTFVLYFAGRSVSWIFVLYEGRSLKPITQALIVVDYAVLFSILLGFNLLRLEYSKRYAVILPVVFLLCAASLVITKNDIDNNCHARQETWEQLKEYCHAHPDNLYVWTYDSGTLENYCESPFDMTLDTYNNFIYTNWGVILSPNSRIKLAQHGIGQFGRDVIDSDSTYFILRDEPHSEEHPVIMYFRNTYGSTAETADTFTAGDTTYTVYQLR